MNLTDREISYLKKWEKRRHKKMRYVLFNGSLLAFVLSGSYFWIIDFNFTQFDTLRYISSLLGYFVMTTWWVYYNFKATEKRYQEAKASGRL